MPPIVAETVAQRFDAVIGLDAHTDTHTAVVVDTLGAVRAQIVVAADTTGTEQLLAWARTHAPGRRLWAIDGTRSHGQGTTQLLLADGQQVVEAARPRGTQRARGGKSDALDATAIARTTLATPPSKLAWPRADGTRETLRILLTYRRHLSDTRTATVNMFKALILTADHNTRSQLRGLPTNRQARLATTWPPPSTPDPSTSTSTSTGAGVEVAARRAHLAALGADIAALNQRINTNLRQLQQLVRQLCPRLLDQPGVGPVTAATALTAWSHPGRLRSEAAFAKLAGTAPVEASSGRITRHRLNRGGDRTLNSALHTIALTRRRIHPPTRDYLTRRHAQGKTGPEITRCLKRYIARQLFKIMETSAVMS
jgi:transposase